MKKANQSGDDFSEEDLRLMELYRQAVNAEHPSADLGARIMSTLFDGLQVVAKLARPLGDSRAFDLYAELTPLQRGRLWKEVTRFFRNHNSVEYTVSIEKIVLRGLAMCPESVSGVGDFQFIVSAFGRRLGRAIWYVWREEQSVDRSIFHHGMSQQGHELLQKFFAMSLLTRV